MWPQPLLKNSDLSFLLIFITFYPRITFLLLHDITVLFCGNLNLLFFSPNISRSSDLFLRPLNPTVTHCVKFFFPQWGKMRAMCGTSQGITESRHKLFKLQKKPQSHHTQFIVFAGHFDQMYFYLSVHVLCCSFYIRLLVGSKPGQWDGQWKIVSLKKNVSLIISVLIWK